MITYIDNFCESKVFADLQQRMLWRFKPGIRQDVKRTFYENLDVYPVRIRTLAGNNNDFTESLSLLGPQILPVLNQIKNYVEDELKYINPLAYSIWFQYMNKKQSVGKHHDGCVHGRPLINSYSTFLYTNSVWEDDWGGELCVNGTELLPKPNRLIIYTRDEQHWVNPMKCPDDNYNRMFFGISWSNDGIKGNL